MGGYLDIARCLRWNALGLRMVSDLNLIYYPHVCCLDSVGFDRQTARRCGIVLYMETDCFPKEGLGVLGVGFKEWKGLTLSKV